MGIQPEELIESMRFLGMSGALQRRYIITTGVDDLQAIIEHGAFLKRIK